MAILGGARTGGAPSRQGCRSLSERIWCYLSSQAVQRHNVSASLSTSHVHGEQVSPLLMASTSSENRLVSRATAPFSRSCSDSHTTPILCPLPTKGSDAEHFGRLSYCFSVKLCFGVCHYQSTELCRPQKFLLHNGVEFDHVTRKHSKHKRSKKNPKQFSFLGLENNSGCKTMTLVQ